MGGMANSSKGFLRNSDLGERK
jgi:hypothetical protein